MTFGVAHWCDLNHAAFSHPAYVLILIVGVNRPVWVKPGTAAISQSRSSASPTSAASGFRRAYVVIIGGGPPKPKMWAIPCSTVMSTVWMTLVGTASVMNVLITAP
jgi:hypothetical protein